MNFDARRKGRWAEYAIVAGTLAILAIAAFGGKLLPWLTRTLEKLPF